MLLFLRAIFCVLEGASTSVYLDILFQLFDDDLMTPCLPLFVRRMANAVRIAVYLKMRTVRVQSELQIEHFVP